MLFHHQGWEMTRAGAIARQVIDELESLGCDTMEGCPNNADAMEAFEGRSLSDYYTEGYGTGLSFQELCPSAANGRGRKSICMKKALFAL
jgi:urease alpha subunit